MQNKKIVILLVMLVDRGFSQDWPQWRGTNSAGVAQSVQPFSAGFQLSQRWSRELGYGYSNIAVIGSSAVMTYSNGKDDFLTALHLDDGREIWLAKLGPSFQGRHGSEDGPSSSPCVIDGRVIALSSLGQLVAVDLHSGRQLWNTDVTTAFGGQLPWYGFGSSPVRCGSYVFLAMSNPDGTAGLALNASDGSVAWQRKGGRVGYQGAYWNQPVNELVVADSRYVAVLQAESGLEKYRFAHTNGRGSLAHPQLVPVDRHQFLLAHENFATLYKVDQDRAPHFNERWRSRELRDSYSPPVVHDGHVFGMCGTFLVCVDLSTGRRRWKTREPGARGVTLVNGYLVLFSSGGEIVVAEASHKGYREVTREKVAARGGYTTPVWANGCLCVRNTSTVACIDTVPALPSESQRSVPAGPAGDFADFIQQVERSEDPTAMVDRWWRGIKRTPIVENQSTVHFVYVGKADDVALLGDMTQDRNVADSMQRVANTDLFYRSYTYNSDGLWHYAFLVDYERVELDVRNGQATPALVDVGGNPRSMGYGGHEWESVLQMPGWKKRAFLTQVPTQTGRLEPVSFDSGRVPSRNLQVYLPSGYDQGARRYPTIYVLGGAEWLEHGDLPRAFDNLMQETCEPAIAVFVPYHDGSQDRIGAASYADLVLRKIVPTIQNRFRTREPSVAMAAADDATAAVLLSLKSPHRFARLIVQSPFMDGADLELLAGVQGAPEVCYLDWSRYEPRVQDENLDYRAAARQLRSELTARGVRLHGTEVTTGPGWTSWVSRIDQALAAVLPRRKVPHVAPPFSN